MAAIAHDLDPVADPMLVGAAPQRDHRPVERSAGTHRPRLRAVDPGVAGVHAGDTAYCGDRGDLGDLRRIGAPHRDDRHDRYEQPDLASVVALHPVPSVEVYRRRRFVALLVATVLILAVAWSTGMPMADFGGAPVPAVDPGQPTVHVVAPGDSYGAIASSLGAADPVGVADQLRAANGGGELMVGQRLVIDVAAIGLG